MFPTDFTRQLIVWSGTKVRIPGFPTIMYSFLIDMKFVGNSIPGSKVRR
jgi:hypothetical protein